jgi:hypothetical protein
MPLRWGRPYNKLVLGGPNLQIYLESITHILGKPAFVVRGIQQSYWAGISA